MSIFNANYTSKKKFMLDEKKTSFINHAWSSNTKYNIHLKIGMIFRQSNNLKR